MMVRRWPGLILSVLLVGGITSACQSSSGSLMSSESADAPEAAGRVPAAAGEATMEPEAAAETGGGAQSEVAAATPLPDAVTGAGSSTRKIIKDGTMAIEVDSVGLALSLIDGIAAQSGGYVVESRTDQSDALRKRGFIKIAVPVAQFEAALQRIREASGKVLSEQASGTDVSQEYVDVQSQIANLEATQARVRSFLEDAKTVEEALQVNSQLTEIEGQLSQHKGRLQFLAQRSAFSTIAVDLQEKEAPPTATPTPTPRPPWQPGQTAGRAVDALTTLLRGLTDLAIWCAIVLLPLVLLVALPLALIWWVVRSIRRRRKPSA
jgi:hypothetical protein